MAEDKKSILVYADWIDKFEKLDDDEAGRLIKHFFRFVNDLNPTAPDKLTEIAFVDIESTLKRDLKKWEKKIEGRSLAGKASAEARKLAKEQDSTNSTNVESVQQDSTNSTVTCKLLTVNNNINNKSRFEDFLDQCIKDEIWKETFYIKRQLTSENFSYALKDYNIHLLQQSENKNSLSEYKKHFANWVGKMKEIKSNKNDT